MATVLDNLRRKTARPDLAYHFSNGDTPESVIDQGEAHEENDPCAVVEQHVSGLKTKERKRIWSQLFSQHHITTQQRSKLRASLLKTFTALYAKQLAEEMRRLGYPEHTPRLTDPQVKSQLAQLATEHATLVQRTYNRLLERAITQLPADPPQNQIEQVIRQQIEQARSYTDTVLLPYLQGKIRDLAQRDFYTLNNIEARWTLDHPVSYQPETEDCQEALARSHQGPVDHRYRSQIPMPNHRRCQGRWEPVIPDDATLPPPEQLWDGDVTHGLLQAKEQGLICKVARRYPAAPTPMLEARYQTLLIALDEVRRNPVLYSWLRDRVLLDLAAVQIEADLRGQAVTYEGRFVPRDDPAVVEAIELLIDPAGGVPLDDPRNYQITSQPVSGDGSAVPGEMVPGIISPGEMVVKAAHSHGMHSGSWEESKHPRGEHGHFASTPDDVSPKQVRAMRVDYHERGMSLDQIVATHQVDPALTKDILSYAVLREQARPGEKLTTHHIRQARYDYEFDTPTSPTERAGELGLELGAYNKLRYRKVAVRSVRDEGSPVPSVEILPDHMHTPSPVLSESVLPDKTVPSEEEFLRRVNDWEERLIAYNRLSFDERDLLPKWRHLQGVSTPLGQTYTAAARAMAERDGVAIFGSPQVRKAGALGMHRRQDGSIRMNPDLNGTDEYPHVLIHEISHLREPFDEARENYDKRFEAHGLSEIRAEMSAALVSQHIGIPTAGSLNYLLEWYRARGMKPLEAEHKHWIASNAHHLATRLHEHPALQTKTAHPHGVHSSSWEESKHPRGEHGRWAHVEHVDKETRDDPRFQKEHAWYQKKAPQYDKTELEKLHAYHQHRLEGQHLERDHPAILGALAALHEEGERRGLTWNTRGKLVGEPSANAPLHPKRAFDSSPENHEHEAMSTWLSHIEQQGLGRWSGHIEQDLVDEGEHSPIARALDDANARALAQAVHDPAMTAIAHDFFDAWGDGGLDERDTAHLQTAVADVHRLQGVYHPVAEQAPATDTARLFARAQYDHTQRVLTALGVDEVVLYRGMSFDDPPSEIAHLPTESDHHAWTPATLSSRPVSSWSTSFAIARLAAVETMGDHAYVYATRVPRQRIFSTAYTGMGSVTQLEYNILGGTDTVGVTKVPSMFG